jgi:hypothetical protein
MVVQVRRDALRLVRQLDHSLASGRMALEWIGPDGRADPPPADVVRAIALHDLAWAREDREPAWDARSGAPVSFLSIADDRRLALYREGLDRVEGIDATAALLGSLHYSRFVAAHEDAAFLAREEARRARLAARVTPRRDEAAWRASADLLRHLDDLSLFVCLAAPGSEGVPDWLSHDRVATAPGGLRHELRWDGPGTLALRPFPFRREIALAIPCRDLPRGPWDSAEELLRAWRLAAPRSHEIRLLRA